MSRHVAKVIGVASSSRPPGQAEAPKENAVQRCRKASECPALAHRKSGVVY
jgi:hypothetical protein